MLKLEKSQYQNSIFQLNYTKYEKRENIENRKLNFLTTICEI